MMTSQMTKLSLLLLSLCIWVSLICVSSAVPSTKYPILDKFPSEEELFPLFQQWTKEYDRVYKDLEEEAERFEIFKMNLKYITESNAKRSSVHDHHLGLNKFADMKPEEFRKMYLSNPILPTNVTLHGNNELCKVVPSWLDWRMHGIVTPVKNQQSCGCCWSFAATGAIEGLNALVTGKLYSVSEQELLDCVTDNFGCNGGYYDRAFQWVKDNGGINTEDNYPYTAKQGACDANKRSHKVVTIDGFKEVGRSEGELVCAVAKQPVSVCVDASDFQHYTGGIYSGGSCSNDPYKINHAVLVVGYSYVGGKDYWIVKNSWGDDWGTNGYIFIRRNIGVENGVCAVNAWAVYPTKSGQRRMDYSSSVAQA